MPRTRRLHSANDEFQLAASLLTNRRQRAHQGRFVVEGVRAIDEAVAHAWPVESFWYARGRRLSRWAQGLLDSGVADTHYELDEELLAQLSGREETSELLAVAPTKPDDLARIPAPGDAPVVVFDRPVSPGNLGSVVRSADTLGAAGVAVTGHAADVYDPQAVRASVGSLFAIPVVRAPAMSEVRAWLERLRGDVPGLRVVGSSARATTSIDEADLSGPVVVVLGNETRGLSTAWRELSDELVVIPMRRDDTSLNAAAAAAILLYECRGGRA